MKKIAIRIYMYGNTFISTNYKPEWNNDDRVIMGRLKNTNVWLIGTPYDMRYLITNKELKELENTNEFPYDELYFIYKGQEYDLLKERVPKDWILMPTKLCADLKCQYRLKCLLETTNAFPFNRSCPGTERIWIKTGKIANIKTIPREFSRVVDDLISQNVDFDKFTTNQLKLLFRAHLFHNRSYKIPYKEGKKFLNFIHTLWKYIDILLKAYYECEDPIIQAEYERQIETLQAYCKRCEFHTDNNYMWGNHKKCQKGKHPILCPYKKYIDLNQNTPNLIEHLLEEFYERNKEIVDKIAYFFEHPWPIKFKHKKLDLNTIDFNNQILTVRDRSGNTLDISFNTYEKLRRKQPITVRVIEMEKWIKAILYLFHKYEKSNDQYKPEMHYPWHRGYMHNINRDSIRILGMSVDAPTELVIHTRWRSTNYDIHCYSYNVEKLLPALVCITHWEEFIETINKLYIFDYLNLFN